MRIGMNCEEAARVISDSLDRSLGTAEWLQLKLHLVVCKQCPHFLQQLETMRTVMQHWRSATEILEANAQEKSH